MDVTETPFTHEHILLENILRVCHLHEPCTQSPISLSAQPGGTNFLCILVLQSRDEADMA